MTRTTQETSGKNSGSTVVKIFPIPILCKPYPSFLKVLEVETTKELHINTRLYFVICTQKCFFLQQATSEISIRGSS